MTTFEKNGGGMYTQKGKGRFLASSSIRRYFIATVVMGSLTNCADVNFRKDTFGSGMLEIGQDMAHYNCKKQQPNFHAYQACINQVDENYNEAYK